MRLARGAGALGERGFFLYTIGNGLSAVGHWVQRMAIGWLAWELSRSEFWVGLIAFALFAPVLLFSPLFGVLIDRAHPRRAAMLINGLMVTWAALLGLLSFLGLLGVELLFGLSLAIGTTTAAYAPVRLSVVPSLVPRALVPSAISINSVVFNVSRLVGPAAAGFVLVLASAGWAFLINAVSYLPLIAALAVVPMRVAEKRPRESFAAEFLAGLAHARENPFILWQLLLTAWGSLFGRAILEVLPVYADELYGRGAVALAYLSSAAGGGALVAAMLASRLEMDSRQLHRGTIALNLATAVALLILPLSGRLASGVALVAVIGFGSAGAAVLSQTVVQLEVADDMRGRVSSLWGMAGLGGSAFGGLLLGLALHLMGITLATCAGAVAAMLLPIIAWRRTAPLRSSLKGALGER